MRHGGHLWSWSPWLVLSAKWPGPGDGHFLWNSTARGETSVLVGKCRHTAYSDRLGREEDLIQIDEARGARAKGITESGNAPLELSKVVGETLATFFYMNDERQLQVLTWKGKEKGAIERQRTIARGEIGADDGSSHLVCCPDSVARNIKRGGHGTFAGRGRGRCLLVSAVVVTALELLLPFDIILQALFKRRGKVLRQLTDPGQFHHRFGSVSLAFSRRRERLGKMLDAIAGHVAHKKRGQQMRKGASKSI